jgi:hypothetical protein
MANFKDAFAEARKAGKKQFDFGGKSYTTDVAKGDSTPRYQSGALKGMRRDPNEGETQAERSKRLREREQKLMAARPKPPAPKPTAESAPKRSSASDALAAEQKAEAARKARAQENVRNAVSSVRSGVRAAGEKAKEAVGEAKQLPGRAVGAGLRAIGAPDHAVTTAALALGDKRTLTEKDLSDDTKAQAQRAVNRAKARGSNSVEYSDYVDKKGKVVPYRRGSLDRNQQAIQTLGQFSFKTGKDGKDTVFDNQDFDSEGREAIRAKYDNPKMSTFDKVVDTGKRIANDVKTGGIGELKRSGPSRLADLMIGKDGRPVEIKLARGGPTPPRVPNMPSRFMDSDASRTQLEKEIKERYKKSADPKNDRRLMGDAKLHNELFNPNNHAKGGTVKKYAKGGTTGQTKQQPYAGMKQKMLSEYAPPKPKMYAKGGGIESKGKTKGRFV